MKEEVRSDYGFWILAIGIIPSALSIISVTQRSFSIGLTSIFADIVSYYRKIAFPVFDILPFTVPGWYKDLFILSLVLLVTALRAAITSKGYFEEFIKVQAAGDPAWTGIDAVAAGKMQEDAKQLLENPKYIEKGPFSFFVRTSLFGLVLNSLLLGLLIPLIVLLIWIQMSRMKRKPAGKTAYSAANISLWRTVVARYVISIVVAVFAAIAFFAMNAGA
jgi:hypothetical protein